MLATPSSSLSPAAVENQLERVVEGYSSPRLLVQHRQRYQFALRYLRESDVAVDCACGSGYGAFLLAEKARRVLGIDIAPLAIEYAKARYSKPNLEFLVGRGEALPLPSGSVEVFCSFETLEHLQRVEDFLAEAARTLKPGGRFLFSTPNRVAFGIERGARPDNPHHQMEWSPLELDRILQARFTRREYFGQRVRSRSKLAPAYWLSKLNRLLGRLDLVRLPAGEERLEALEDPRHWQPEYFLGVCKKAC